MNEKKRKFWIRLTAILLAVLMAGGTLYTALVSLLG